MTKKCWICCFAAGTMIGLSLVWFLTSRRQAPSPAPQTIQEERTSQAPHPKFMAKSTPEASQPPPTEKGAIRPRRIDRVEIGDPPPVPAQVEKEQLEEAKERVREKWNHVCEEVLAETCTLPLPERGKRVKEAFEALPQDEKEIEMQSLLNLLPDESFEMMREMVLDVKGDPDVVNQLFNDLLNRPEELKEPYLMEIAQKKDHPAFVDAAHICEVTGLREKMKKIQAAEVQE